MSVEPICTAPNGPPGACRPMVRSSHPERALVPGAARSISSMAAKCERFGEVMPAACTNASLLVFQNGCSAESAGCSPNMESSWNVLAAGIRMLGRHVA